MIWFCFLSMSILPDGWITLRALCMCLLNSIFSSCNTQILRIVWFNIGGVNHPSIGWSLILQTIEHSSFCGKKQFYKCTTLLNAHSTASRFHKIAFTDNNLYYNHRSVSKPHLYTVKPIKRILRSPLPAGGSLSIPVSLTLIASSTVAITIALDLWNILY